MILLPGIPCSLAGPVWLLSLIIPGSLVCLVILVILVSLESLAKSITPTSLAIPINPAILVREERVEILPELLSEIGLAN